MSAVLYEVTLRVERAIAGDYQGWLHGHVREMLALPGFLDARVSEVLEALSAEIGLSVCDLSFPLVAARAREANWTRDPFDRLIVAQAQARGAPLITRDRLIRKHYARAIWDSARSET